MNLNVLSTYWESFLDYLYDWWRWKYPEPRIWLISENFRESICENQLDRILVSLGFVTTRNQAQKLIKQGGVKWREWAGSPWRRVSNYQESLPSGVPIFLSVGSWKGNPFYTQGVMIPEPTQHLRFWMKFYEEQMYENAT